MESDSVSHEEKGEEGEEITIVNKVNKLKRDNKQDLKSKIEEKNRNRKIKSQLNSQTNSVTNSARTSRVVSIDSFKKDDDKSVEEDSSHLDSIKKDQQDLQNQQENVKKNISNSLKQKILEKNQARKAKSKQTSQRNSEVLHIDKIEDNDINLVEFKINNDYQDEIDRQKLSVQDDLQKKISEKQQRILED